jgi:hypothetical protein
MSYALALKQPPTAQVVPAGQTTPECPGSAAVPEAAADTLCLYLAASSTASVEVFNPGGSGAARFGFGVRLLADGRAAGSWAVTAP